MNFIHFRKLKTAILPNYFTNSVARFDLLTPGTLLIILISIWTFIIWIFFRSDPNIIFENTNTAIIKFTGILGIVMLSFSFILATRWKILEDLFESLEKVYKVHDLIGRTIITLGIIHFALTLYAVRDNFDILLNFLLPFRTVPSTYGILGFYGLILLIILTVWIRMPYQVWLQIHKLMIIPFTLLVLHGYAIKSGDFYNVVELKAWLSFWIIWGFLAYFYKLFLYKYFAEKYYMKVLSIRSERDHTEIILGADNERFKKIKQIKFYPSQFVFISFYKTFANLSKEKHPFSISNYSEDGKIRIIAKDLGDYTSKLRNLKVGDKALVYGPYGDFSHRYFISKKDMVWIAGGIGIAPFLSLAEHILYTKDLKRRVNLFYSVKTKEEFIYSGFLKNLESKFPNFKLHLFDVETNRKFLDVKFIGQSLGGMEDLKKQNFFMCGPVGMMNALSNDLVKNGVKPRDIEAEEFDFG